MRALGLATILAALPLAAPAQEQQALRPPPAGAAAQPFDLVAGDRETAWRINRATGEVLVCRLDTASSLDTVRARCSPVQMEGAAAQQSQLPPPGEAPRP